MAKPTQSTLTLSFTPYDTWFFRESRPHDAVGASELSSLFPPPVKTLIGAFRSHLGEQAQIDWRTRYSESLKMDLSDLLGASNQLGPVSLNGPWIHRQGQRLYPAPLYLMHKDQDIQRLEIGPTVRCDLGNVRLPQLAAGLKGYKTLENRWLTSSGLSKCLNGQVPTAQECFSTQDLFSLEPRLGIARNNQQRQVLEGKLYQTQHLRLKAEIDVQLEIHDLPDALLAMANQANSPVLRLGGEGRMASLNSQNSALDLPDLKPINQDSFVIHFMTAADFNGQMFPADFTKQQNNGQTVWQGQINGIECQIEAAVIGKAHREGGWDMQNHQPHPVKSYIPAGSAWFCRLTKNHDWQTLKQQLHGQSIGNDSAFGRGQILIGHWSTSHN